MSEQVLSAYHQREANELYIKTQTHMFDLPEERQVTMTEAVYHATMAVLHQLKAQA